MKQARLLTICISLLIITRSELHADSAPQNLSPQLPMPTGDPLHFAVIGDLSGGERPGVFASAMRGIDALQPDLILSVGDLVEGGTNEPARMASQWRSFQNFLQTSDRPFFPVVGNHDISSTEMRAWYEANIAPRYYHFVYRRALFLMLDSEDFSDETFEELATKRDAALKVYNANPAAFEETEYAKMPERMFGRVSENQTEYAVSVIDANTDVDWTFILMHKPVWRDASESNFSKIESALSGRGYTVFTGHEHSYKHAVRNQMDYIQLATTGGVMPREGPNNMDHILWVSLEQGTPRYLNIKLSGMVDKTGYSLSADQSPDEARQAP